VRKVSVEKQPVPLRERVREQVGKDLMDLKVDFMALVLKNPYAQQLYLRREQAKHPEKQRAQDVAAGMTTEELEEKLGVR